MKNRKYKLGFYSVATLCWFGAAVYQFSSGETKLGICNLLLGALTLGLTIFWLNTSKK